MNDRSKTALPVSVYRYRRPYMGIVPEGTMVLPREARGPRLRRIFSPCVLNGRECRDVQPRALFLMLLSALFNPSTLRPFAPHSAFDGRGHGPRAGQEFLEPERADDRLHVAEFAAADPLRYFGHRRGEGLDEFALIEFCLARHQAAREVDVDKFGRVGNDRMDAREEDIFARRIARFFFELTLRAGQ